MAGSDDRASSNKYTKASDQQPANAESQGQNSDEADRQNANIHQGSNTSPDVVNPTTNDATGQQNSVPAIGGVDIAATENASVTTTGIAASIPLAQTIQTALANTQNVESVTINGLPDGASLSTGTQNPDGSYTLNTNQISDVSLRLGETRSDPLDLTLTTTIENSSETVTQTIAIQPEQQEPPEVNLEADTPILEVADTISGMQNTAVALPISVQLTDANETLSIVITGAPDDAVLSLGTKDALGNWIIQGDELTHLNDLTITSSAGNYDLSVTAISTEQNAQQATTTQQVSVAMENLIQGDDNKNTITGTDANDIVYAGDNIDKVYGGAGDDVLHGEGHRDWLYGQDGNDILYGGERDDELHGGAGDDVLHGGDASDKLYGDEGNDTIHGGEGNDDIRAGAGDDVVHADSGNDKIYGGDGHDELHGGSGNDNIRGEVGDDVIHGGSGNDTLQGNEGDDVIRGGDNNDKLSGHEGDDVMHGDGGDDKLWGHEGNDTLYGGEGKDRIEGGDGDDIIYGEGGDDTIYGDSGDDVIHGGAGNDRLEGDKGDDVLYGGPGDDHLDGDKGDDILYAGSGDDRLYGGSDSDTFIFNSGDGRDNFVHGGHDGWVDTIQLNDISKAPYIHGIDDIPRGNEAGAWVLEINNDRINPIVDPETNTVTFDDGPVSGTITYLDGSNTSIEFQKIEAIQWDNGD